MMRVIIIGGGASGLMAAITAARNGAKVTVLEHQNQVGKKILITGNGRCNFTNADADSLSHYYATDKDFVGGVLSRFSVCDILSFFECRNLYYFHPNLQDSNLLQEELLAPLVSKK